MLVDGLRPLWLPALASVDGNPVSRVSEWIGQGQYYFDAPVGPTAASFVLTPGLTLLDTFAAEMSRFSSAAIETSVGIVRSDFPKSTAWLFIQTYYAAFYAAHSILRSVGISASNLRTGDCHQVDRIASALGFNNAPLNVAQYRCEYLANSGRLNCSKASGSGIHEQFWKVFGSFLQKATTAVMHNTLLTRADAQDVFSRLDDLRTVLTWNVHPAGNWLSSIRNEVTYMQQHNAWFPYGRNRADCNRLFILQRQWRGEPESINLRAFMSSDSELFIVTCAFLVSLSVSIAKDMALRHPAGISFLVPGPLKLLNQFSR